MASPMISAPWNGSKQRTTRQNVWIANVTMSFHFPLLLSQNHVRNNFETTLNIAALAHRSESREANEAKLIKIREKKWIFFFVIFIVLWLRLAHLPLLYCHLPLSVQVALAGGWCCVIIALFLIFYFSPPLLLANVVILLSYCSDGVTPFHRIMWFVWVVFASHAMPQCHTDVAGIFIARLHVIIIYRHSNNM